jgi:hypothetical protein
MESLIKDILPIARASVPPEIKTAILLQLHSALCDQQQPFPQFDQNSKQ